MSNRIVSLNVDFNDEILNCEDFGYSQYDEDKIRLLVEMAANSGFNRILWRISVCGKVDYPSKVENVYDYTQHNKIPISDDYDPLKIAAKYARQFGVEIYAWMTLYDDNPAAMQNGSNDMASVLCETHPEWQLLSRDGGEYYQGVFCFAYPGVREHKLAMLAELAQYDIDGIFLSTRHHSRTQEFWDKSMEYIDGKMTFEELDRYADRARDNFGFNDPIVEEYKKRYEADIRTEEFDRELWNKLRGEYLTLFLSEAKQLLSSHDMPLSMMVKDENRGKSIGGHQLGWILGDLYTDWEKWVEDGVIDELCLYDEERLTWWNFREDNWPDGALDFVEKYRSVANDKVKLLLWIDVRMSEWRANPTYMERYGHPGRPWHGGRQGPHAADTKPPEVIEKMMTATLASAADGFTLHEAQNIEWFSLWKSIKDVAGGQ
ncbi:MAG: family 10 glycosylhydrolase [Phycisphaerae bacterium]|nr:family 10 glycosylhydrolase [Phycisphaerae bacterium]